VKRAVSRAAVLALLTAACQGRYVALDPASPEASRINDLHWLMFWVTGAVSVVVVGLLAAAVFRRAEPPTRQGDERRTRAVAAGAAVSGIILIYFLFVSVRAGRDVVAPGGPDSLEIDITGHQWWWEVRYPATPPSDTVVTANEIHIPVGRPVRLQLSSADVIHSFWAPNFHGKKDLLPGRPTTHIFRADRAGVFPGMCAEFCGYQHAHMGFLVIAEDPERFQAWLDGQRRPAAEPEAAALRHGREVFLSSPCVLCHTIRGIGAFGHKAPDLTHLGSRRMIAAATVPNTPGHLAGWVVDAQNFKPGNKMPPNTLAAGDLLDLVSYLGSLQ